MKWQGSIAKMPYIIPQVLQRPELPCHAAYVEWAKCVAGGSRCEAQYRAVLQCICRAQMSL